MMVSKLGFTKHEYIRAALMIDVPAKKIAEKIPFLRMVNTKEYNKLVRADAKIISHIDIKMVLFNNKVYFYNGWTTTTSGADKAIIICYAYLALTAEPFELSQFSRWSDDYLRRRNDTLNEIRRIQNRLANFSDLGHFKPISFASIRKYARKVNADLSIDDNKIWITYKNVKVVY